MRLTPEKSDLVAFVHSHMDKTLSATAEGATPKITDYLLMLSGLYVEACFLFEKPDETMEAGFSKIADMLRAQPYDGSISSWTLPHSQHIDQTSEQGRELSRFVLDEWQECEFSYFDFVLWVLQSYLTIWENENIPREESLRLFMEFSTRCMAYEISAQELCDLVIETKISSKEWSLADGVCGLSAYAGHSFGHCTDESAQCFFVDADEQFQTIMSVMTQEASRMGVPAGSSWHLGMAANDCPADPPTELIEAIKPMCDSFFKALSIMTVEEQAVACAKAAGRMLAVVATGDTPDMPHDIAKPLAMAALIESYRGLRAMYPSVKSDIDAFSENIFSD
ncbi:MAG: hypothetical protein JKY11_09155 [Alphaproteobacteria bacterium]|nr:hypothetical protein [Alphaproteobacteria bacterium]